MPPKKRNKSKNKEIKVTYLPPPSTKNNAHEVEDYDPQTKVVDEFERDLDFLLKDDTVPSASSTGETEASKVPFAKKWEDTFRPGELTIKGPKKLSDRIKNEILDFDVDFSSDDDSEPLNLEGKKQSPSLEQTNVSAKSFENALPLEISGPGRPDYLPDADVNEDKRILDILEQEMIRELSAKNILRNLDELEIDSSVTGSSDELSEDLNFDENGELKDDYYSYDYDDLDVSDTLEEPQFSEERKMKNEDSTFTNDLTISGYRPPEAEGEQMDVLQLRAHISELSNYNNLSAPQKRRRMKRLKQLFRILARKEGKDEDFYFDDQDNIPREQFAEKMIRESISVSVTVSANPSVTSSEPQTEIPQSERYMPLSKKKIRAMKIVDIDVRLRKVNKLLKDPSTRDSDLVLLRAEKELLRQRKISHEQEIIAKKGNTPSANGSNGITSSKSGPGITTLRIVDIDRRLNQVNQALKNKDLKPVKFQLLVEEREQLRQRKRLLDLEKAATKNARTIPLPTSIFDCEMELRKVNTQLKEANLSIQDSLALTKLKESLKLQRENLLSLKASSKSKAINNQLIPEELERTKKDAHIQTDINVNKTETKKEKFPSLPSSSANSSSSVLELPLLSKFGQVITENSHIPHKFVKTRDELDPPVPEPKNRKSKSTKSKKKKQQKQEQNRSAQ